ncbi:MAG: hypothetical protein IJJ25_04970 [Lachnospiraceae bacterium]|nr:hypothetical protein [Lachnospiraceae bacterium]
MHKNRKRYSFRIILLFVLTLLLLMASSWVCTVLYRNPGVLDNNNSLGILEEPENTIDVVAVGDSDVYSAVNPMILWKKHGITAYDWSEAGAKMYDCRYYLKHICSRQTPRVVMISVNSLFADDTRTDILDRKIRAALAYRFPVFEYHRYWRKIKMFPECLHSAHAVTKGFYARASREPAPKKKIRRYMKPSGGTVSVPAEAEKELMRCVELAEGSGAKVLLIAIPCVKDWSFEKSAAMTDLAETEGLDLLDLSLQPEVKINWRKDTCDGGEHLNYRGARKVSRFLGDYLKAHYDLPDHKGENGFDRWEEDYILYKKALAERLAE